MLLSDVRFLAYDPLDFEFYRMPLLAFGCKATMFGILFTGERTRFVVNTLESAREAFVAIVACPTAFLRHTNLGTGTSREESSTFATYKAGFVHELAYVRERFWPTFKAIVGEGSIERFYADPERIRTFFQTLIEFTLLYVSAYWRYALCLYGYTPDCEQYETLGLTGCVPYRSSFTAHERETMRRVQADATAYRENAFPALKMPSQEGEEHKEEEEEKQPQQQQQPGFTWRACGFASERAYKARMNTPLSTLFVDLYRGAGVGSGDCVHLSPGCEVGTTGAFLLHALGDCATLPERELMLPEQMTLADLYVHWNQVATLILKEHPFVVPAMLNVYSAKETGMGDLVREDDDDSTAERRKE